MDDPGYELELFEQRDRLLEAFEAVDDPASLFMFQLSLVAEIKTREPDAFAGKSRAAKEHLRLLRLLGDGLAWRHLDRYAIRQLAKNPAAPPSLTGQGQGFELTLETARKVTDHGHPCLIADLTHCLTIGDVIVCTVPGVPFIIECGGNPRFSHKGRKGRQRKRAEAVSQLLIDGQATFPNHRLPTRSLEVTTPGDHSWEVLDRVVMAAVGQGVASEFAADGDLIFAVRTDDDVQLPEFGSRDAMTSPVVATYTRVLERPDPRVPPCVAWDISAEARRLVYQGEIFVGHVVDVSRFLGRRSGDAEIVKILGGDRGFEGFGVTVGEERHSLSPEFLTDVLLGFASVDSVADMMLEGVQRGAELIEAVLAEQELDEDTAAMLAAMADEDGFVSPARASTLM